MAEPGGTRIATPDGDDTLAATTFTRAPPAAAASAGVSADIAVSTSPDTTASNSGAAPWKLAHSIWYGAPCSTPAASALVRSRLTWSPSTSFTFDRSGAAPATAAAPADEPTGAPALPQAPSKAAAGNSASKRRRTRSGSEFISGLAVVVGAGRRERRWSVDKAAGTRVRITRPVFVRIDVEQIGRAQRQLDALGDGIADIEVGQPLGPEVVILRAVGGGLPIVGIVARGLQVSLERADEPARRQYQLGARRRRQIADAATGRVAEPHRTAARIGAERRDLRRRRVDPGDRRMVPVQRRAPAHQAIAAVVAGGVGDEIGAAGARVDAVGEVLYPLGAGQPGRLQRRRERGTEHIAGADDAVLHRHLIAVDGDVDVVSRLEHEAEAEVDRLLRLQILRAELARQRRTIQQQLGQAGPHFAGHRIDVGAVVRLRIADLRQRRRAEARTDRAADRERRREIVAAVDLAAGGVAGAVVVMFRGHRGVDEPIVERIETDVVINRHHVALDARRVGRRQRHAGLRAHRRRLADVRIARLIARLE